MEAELKTPKTAKYANGRRAKRNFSSFIGVNWSKTEQKWRARRRIQGQCIMGGYFEDEQKAAEVSDELYLRFQDPRKISDHRINFPVRSSVGNQVKSPEIIDRVKPSFKGVIWKRRQKQFLAVRVLNGEKLYGGIYNRADAGVAARNADEIYRRNSKQIATS